MLSKRFVFMLNFSATALCIPQVLALSPSSLFNEWSHWSLTSPCLLGLRLGKHIRENSFCCNASHSPDFCRPDRGRGYTQYGDHHRRSSVDKPNR